MMALYGFKKGKESIRKGKGKPITVYKLVGTFGSAAEVKKVTGIVSPDYFAKNEKIKDGYILTYNKTPGEKINIF